MLTISLMRYGRVFLYDSEGNCVGAYRQENVAQRLIEYLKQPPIRRQYRRDSYQSLTIPVQALAISDNGLYFLWSKLPLKPQS